MCQDFPTVMNTSITGALADRLPELSCLIADEESCSDRQAVNIDCVSQLNNVGGSKWVQ